MPGWGTSEATVSHRSLRPSRTRVGTLQPELVDSTPMTPPVLTRQQVLDRLATREAEILELGVRRLALFGSVLHGRARPESDVDLLVEFRAEAKTFRRFLQLAELLESTLGRRVELVTTEALSPYIGPRILAEAQDVIRAA